VLVYFQGNTGAERALLLRLHLLQGVLAYLQRRNDDARALLSRVSNKSGRGLYEVCPGHDVKLHPHFHCHW